MVGNNEPKKDQEITNKRDRSRKEKHKPKIWHTNWVYIYQVRVHIRLIYAYNFVCTSSRTYFASSAITLCLFFILRRLLILSFTCYSAQYHCEIVFSLNLFSQQKFRRWEKNKMVHLPASNIFAITVTMSRHSLK